MSLGMSLNPSHPKIIPSYSGNRHYSCGLFARTWDCRLYRQAPIFPALATKATLPNAKQEAIRAEINNNEEAQTCLGSSNACLSFKKGRSPSASGAEGPLLRPKRNKLQETTPKKKYTHLSARDHTTTFCDCVFLEGEKGLLTFSADLLFPAQDTDRGDACTSQWRSS